MGDKHAKRTAVFIYVVCKMVPNVPIYIYELSPFQ